jgi:hypothetical protein
MTNNENQMTKEIPMTIAESVVHVWVKHSPFELRHSLVIRHSDLVIFPSHV